MSEGPPDTTPTRVELWDARHAAPDPIESADADRVPRGLHVRSLGAIPLAPTIPQAPMLSGTVILLV